MQESKPFINDGRPYQNPDFKTVIAGTKWVMVAVWKPVHWVLEAIFVPPPGDEYIQENRIKAMRFMGSF